MDVRGARQAVKRLIDRPWFQGTVIAVILINAAVLGFETSESWMAEHGDATHAVGWATLVVFVVELALRMFAEGWRFWRSGWNVFDFFVVAVAFVPGGQASGVLRVLRILRVLRLLSTIRSMRSVVAALIATIPGMGSIAALLVILLYVSAVMSTELFGATDPEHFGSLGSSLLSLFQVTTGDDWANVVRPTAEAHPWAWGFFVGFVVISTYVVLNLFIAVAVEALDRQTEEDNTEMVDEVEHHMDESTTAILTAIEDLKAQVSALEARLGPGDRVLDGRQRSTTLADTDDV